MKLDLDLQRATSGEHLPQPAQFERWLIQVLAGYRDHASVCIRMVDEPESQSLNRDYRGKDKPTNVLSFPFELPPGIDDAQAQALLGDLVICVPVLEREAAEQGKTTEQHWAHLVIHGALHLLGFDHIDPQDADIMENIERRVLADLGLPDPYLLPDATDSL
ncbi:rRNA maturation RNase YbeY [Saccharospirillum sp. MSK14-1]|uniref:rRNA maturation RNase YbeY n=1 Tax=Saccharospirillum sp. MSK14-1 TaxID=1897632 RepID=UPI000D3CFE6D|nr:rRNA maturation RNase YbeY [Saccharospirillum sp. MSK14-1]PTY38894.1 rRNA maturation RNase YbeY [Saccharospirillum sp. MSK14-1]